MSSVLYTSMTWREMKVIQAARRILGEHRYHMASQALKDVINSQALPAHKEARGEGGLVRRRPVLELPAPQEMRTIDARRL
jgi:hypothetical protein